MKKLLLLLFIISFADIAIAQDKNLVGTWKAINFEGSTAEFIFDSEGYITMISEGIEFGGKEFDLEGIKASLKYETDQTTSPFKLLYRLIDLSGNLDSAAMGGVYRYINNDEILMRLNPNLGQSYDEFSETNDSDTFVLKRQ